MDMPVLMFLSIDAKCECHSLKRMPCLLLLLQRRRLHARARSRPHTHTEAAPDIFDWHPAIQTKVPPA